MLSVKIGDELNVLIQVIEEEIKQSRQKRIPFSRYMELALYEPSEGYYNQPKVKIGKEGDFYTSSSVGSVFGRVWAHVFVRNWHELQLGEDEPLIVLEVGGGTGQFARSVLDTLQEQVPMVYDRLHYLMVEKSPHHRMLQTKELKEHLPHLEWIDTLEEVMNRNEREKPTIIFSNELFDALPVERIKNEHGELLECWVEYTNEGLSEVWIPVERTSLLDYLDEQMIVLPEGHMLEIPLAAKEVYHHLATALERGFLYTVDYGWRKEELLQPHRKTGTLIGYFQHNHITDLYSRPGEIDLTAHVHFDALIKWGEALEIKSLPLQTQREWLLSQGILEYLTEHQDLNPFSEAAKLNRTIVQLISPGGMGDTFKVLTQVKEGK